MERTTKQPMKILVACEFSGIVRDAFIARGHDAISCDLLPTERPGPHHQGDVFDVIGDGWDMMLAFPPCTFLCNSGVRWLYKNGRKDYVRWGKMYAASLFFRDLFRCGIEKVVVENSIMHRYAKAIIEYQYNQIIHPWQFGHGETKATCLTILGLPLLEATNIVSGREARIHKMPPGKDRGHLRSIICQGIADAMAEQWG